LLVTETTIPGQGNMNTHKLKAIPHHFVPFSFQQVGQHLPLHVHPQTYRSRSTLLTHTHAVLRRPSLCWRCSSFFGQREQFPQFLFGFLFPQTNGGRVLYSEPLDYHHYRRAVSNVLCENGGPCQRPLLIEMNWIDRAVPKQPVSSNRPPQTCGEAITLAAAFKSFDREGDQSAGNKYCDQDESLGTIMR
jgi:hypothetical protein